MRRSLAAMLSLATLVGGVGVVAADGGIGAAGRSAGAPMKTTIPPTSGSPALAPTSTPTLTPASAPAPTPAPAPGGTVPSLQTIPGPSMVPTTALPVTTIPMPVPATAVTSFDPLAFFTDAYALLAADPFSFEPMFERVVTNSPADGFVLHLLAVEIMKVANGSGPTAPFVVTAEGAAVRACAPDGKCDVYSDFVAPTGLLESFTVNAVPITGRIGTMQGREVTTESLTVDGAVSYQRPDGQLSVVLFILGGGGSSAFSWDQAVFTDRSGQQYLPDLTASFVPTSLAADAPGGAAVVFPGAPLDGNVSVPVVSGVSGTPAVLTVSMTTF